MLTLLSKPISLPTGPLVLMVASTSSHFGAGLL